MTPEIRTIWLLTALCLLVLALATCERRVSSDLRDLRAQAIDALFWPAPMFTTRHVPVSAFLVHVEASPSW